MVVDSNGDGEIDFEEFCTMMHVYFRRPYRGRVVRSIVVTRSCQVRMCCFEPVLEGRCRACRFELASQVFG